MQVSFLNSSETIFYIFRSRNEMLSIPQKPILKLGKLNCEKLCKL